MKLNPKVVSGLLQSLPPAIERALVAPNIGPNQILRDMRPLLAEVNERNENISSIPLSAFFVQKIWDTKKPDDRYLPTNNWLDIELEKMCFSVYESDILVQIKLRYQTIRRIHFATSTSTAQVCISQL